MGGNSGRRKTLSLTETLKIKPPPRVPLIEGMLDKGELVILAGDPNEGKTPLIAQAAAAVATGTPFVGFPTVQGRVGIIDLESSAARYHEMVLRQWEHLKLGNRPAENIDLFIRGNPADPNSRKLDDVLVEGNEQERFSWLQSMAHSRNYSLMIIDTALQFSTFKAADEERTRRFMKRLVDIKRTAPYPAILITLHLRKPDNKRSRPKLLKDPHAWIWEVLGSGAWSASADVRLGLSREAELHVLAGFRRGESGIGPILLEQHFETPEGTAQPTHWVRTSNVGLAMKAFTRGELRYVNRLPVDEWFPWKDVLQLDIPRATFSRIVKKGEPLGLIEVKGTKKARRYRRTP